MSENLIPEKLQKHVPVAQKRYGLDVWNILTLSKKLSVLRGIHSEQNASSIITAAKKAAKTIRDNSRGRIGGLFVDLGMSEILATDAAALGGFMWLKEQLAAKPDMAVEFQKTGQAELERRKLARAAVKAAATSDQSDVNPSGSCVVKFSVAPSEQIKALVKSMRATYSSDTRAWTIPQPADTVSAALEAAENGIQFDIKSI